MEPPGRNAETLILLTGAVLGEGRALPKGLKIDEKTGPGKKVQNKRVFLRNCAENAENGVSVSPAGFPCCLPFRNPGAQSCPEWSQRGPRGAQGCSK